MRIAVAQKKRWAEYAQKKAGGLKTDGTGKEDGGEEATGIQHEEPLW